MLTITHTPRAGTIIDGTSKGDGTAPILKTAGWKWGRGITAWYIPHSRDRAPHLARIEHTAAALRAAGYDVETDIDTTLRGGTDAHHDRNERLTDRADALAAKAERKATAADAAHARHDHACAALPEGGEPIKVGHHSERRHRRALDRAHTTARAAIEADAAARSAAESARIAARSTDHRYTPAVIHRRIERQSAELRSIERHLTKYRAAGHTAETSSHMHQLELNKAELERDIEYWTAVRAEQDATDGPKLYSRADLRPGCFVNCSGTWHKVIRVNAKSVTVATAYSWTDRLPYDKITDARAEDAHTPIRPGQ
ncbi:DUF3560 domain-containing protein [Rhodococcus ruber]|uniref:DUF3560 domain-containing protein n=1 Tax=Rhodococcus ruber TaxID=1830 RepID=UPI001F41E0B5|nr:DUF3560 domain-containing protein [Rhodococcus ruber]MCF8786780.1 DUF3560 domain-containing protein [Rhodococcus ruber]